MMGTGIWLVPHAFQGMRRFPPNSWKRDCTTQARVHMQRQREAGQLDGPALWGREQQLLSDGVAKRARMPVGRHPSICVFTVV
jgi:hypothetical protein